MEPPMTDEIIEITPDTVFFGNPENKVLIEKFINHLSSLSSHAVIKDEFLIGIIKQLLLIIKAFKNDPEFFDKNCQVNIFHIKDNFISVIKYCMELSLEVNESDKLISAFTDAYRFLSEAGIHIDRFNHELENVFGWVDLNIDKFKNNNLVQINFAKNKMHIEVIKKLINNPLIKNFGSFAKVAGTAKELKILWDNDIDSRQIKINGLEDRLSKIETKSNFVALVHGFKNLGDAKKKEISWSFCSLILIGSVMLAVLIAEIIFVFGHEKISDNLIYLFPALLGIELILFYFFRVVLSIFRATKNQLLQLDLRIALCQFIQSYAEYSGKIKENDATALDRFEALVFSGLASQDANIPTVFDGVEQLSKLFKSVRSA